MTSFRFGLASLAFGLSSPPPTHLLQSLILDFHYDVKARSGSSAGTRVDGVGA